MTGQPTPLRDRLAKALRGKYDSDDVRPSYRAADAVLPVVEAWAAEQAREVETLRQMYTAARIRAKNDRDDLKWARSELAKADAENNANGKRAEQAERERDEARAALHRIRHLHERYRFAGDDTTDYCTECNRLSGGWVPYPCPTLQAIGVAPDPGATR